MDWAEYSTRVPRLEGAKSLTIGALVLGQGEAWFDDFELNKQQSGARVSEKVKRLETEFFDVLESNYLASERLNMDDLREFAHSSLQGASNYTEAYPVFKAVVAKIRDPHAQFISAPEIIARSRTSNRAENSNDSLSPDMVSARNLVRIEGHLAFVEVPTFLALDSQDSSRDSVEALESAVTSASSETICGWVVDLRNNYGGSMWTMLDGLQPFLSDEVLGGHYDAAGNRTIWWSSGSAVGIHSSAGEKVVKSEYGADDPFSISSEVPVAVLVNRNTSSAAEAAAIALNARANTTVIGEATGGLLTANAPIKLSDGSVFVLPVGGTLNHELNPVERVILDIEISADKEAVMRAAHEWIRNHSVCSATQS